MSGDRFRIGVISDTHGLLRDEVKAVLRTCDVILHGGDIDWKEILRELGRIAETYAVRGNNDKDWADYLPQQLDLYLNGLRIFMVHDKKQLPADLTPYDLVIFGHSHKYEESREAGRVLLNPGSCGPRRFHQPITMAVVEIENGRCEVERIEIAHKGAKKPLPGDTGIRTG